MALVLVVPKLNPLWYTLFRGVTYVSATDSVDITTVKNQLFGNLIHPSEQQLTFCQKLQSTDEMQAIFSVDQTSAGLAGSSIQAVLYDHTGKFMMIIPKTNIGTFTDELSAVWDYYLAKFWCNNCPSGPYDSLPEGIYYVGIHFRNGTDATADVFLSEPIHIATTHSDTILLSYNNEKNNFDIIFTGLPTSWNFNMRFDGGFESDGFTPKSNDVIYNDIVQNPVQLSSIPYDTKRITFGRTEGIPNYQAGIINRILACTHIWVDGVRYCKVSGAKLEPTRTKEYPLGGWRIELMESYGNWSQYGHLIQRVLGYGNIAFQGNDLIQA
jgi:hypothetical protein